MSQQVNEFFSKVEEKYDVKLKRVTKCPVTGREGQPMPGNPLVWFVAYKDNKGTPIVSRWSYSTGRIVSPSAQDTNVL